MTDDDWHSLGLMSDDELESAIRRLGSFPWEVVVIAGMIALSAFLLGAAFCIAIYGA